MKFYCHPTCTTCKKAQQWLEINHIDYTFINLKETAPSKEMLMKLMKQSKRPLKQFFNTSGQLYRQYELKDKVSDMSIKEAAEWLSKNGMLVKRPLAIKENKFTIGFKEKEYEAVWLSAEKENTK
ncbi:Arsenate reductase [Marinilactibacillus psychrotolerans 42ea]|uniref:Arsenate reductase n=1 Tax=Marinilactibacillus psychrotolerans 42ea TaxID=1255609 RepID=A0A1R4JVP4_9LACT|nr:arsenate reductase family protein [Marinilactibacillus psychrotolerans]SJN36039.1 Arsenate reductase [Marinilactibacillus psychrotolerans 42ea]